MKIPMTMNKINCARNTIACSCGVSGRWGNCSPGVLLFLSGTGQRSDMGLRMEFHDLDGKSKLGSGQIALAAIAAFYP